MRSIAMTEELARVAQRCVWFKAPQDALSYPEHFIAHVLTFGTHDDVKALRRTVSDDELKKAIDNAPPEYSTPAPGPTGI